MAIASNVKKNLEASSWIRRMFELGIALKRERGEENVFDLSLGNPVIQPPPEFVQELRKFADAPPPGAHRYMPNAGYPETRQAIADALANETGLPYGAQHVMMTVGAAGALNVVMHALCDPGDEVIIFAPYFAEYLFYVGNHGATPVVIGCDADFTRTSMNWARNSPPAPSSSFSTRRTTRPARSILSRSSPRWPSCSAVRAPRPARRPTSSATSPTAGSSSTATPTPSPSTNTSAPSP